MYWFYEAYMHVVHEVVRNMMEEIFLNQLNATFCLRILLCIQKQLLRLWLQEEYMSTHLGFCKNKHTHENLLLQI